MDVMIKVTVEYIIYNNCKSNLNLFIVVLFDFFNLLYMKIAL